MKTWAMALVVMNLCVAIFILSCKHKKKGEQIRVGDWNDGSPWVTEPARTPIEWLAFSGDRKFGGEAWLTMTGCQAGQYRPECTTLRSTVRPMVVKDGEAYVIKFER